MVLVLNNFIGGEFVGSHNDNNNDGKDSVIERLVLVHGVLTSIGKCTKHTNAIAAPIQLLEKFMPFYQTPLQKMLR